MSVLFVWAEFALQIGPSAIAQPTRPTRPPKSLPEIPAPRTVGMLPRPNTEQSRYSLTRGQEFAYRLEIEISRVGSVERFAGTPYFFVHTVDSKGKAEIECVGRLVFATRGRDDADFIEFGGNDMWVASRLVVDSEADRIGGRKDQNLSALPPLLSEFSDLRHFIFPQISSHFKGDPTTVRFSEGSAMLFTHTQQPILGVGLKMTRGRRRDSVKMESAGPLAAKLLTEQSFVTTEGEPREWRFTSTSQFDLKRGLVSSSDGRYRMEDSSQRADVLTMALRLLDGDDLRRARLQAESDRKLMVQDQIPIELNRVRVEMPHLPPRIKETANLAPGTPVVHYNDVDHYWCHAVVIDIINSHRVTIRYRGSSEEMDIPVGQLAYPPAK